MSARSSVVRSSIVRFLVGSYCDRASFFGPLLRLIPLNDTTKQLLSLSRPEQRAYFEMLYRYNKKQTPATTSRSALYAITRTAGLVRRFNQLPCTVESRSARAELLNDADRDTKRILVLGDDDLLAVELSRRGFKHVTVADCDARLLERIRQETASFPTPPRIVQADFRVGFDSPEAMDVVFLDPPYSIGGAQAFMKLAVAATKGKRGAKLYLMINPGIFGSGFAELTSVVTRAGFRLSRHLPAFNGYPIGWLESTALKSAWRVILNVPGLKRPDGLHFCSDCFEYERS